MDKVPEQTITVAITKKYIKTGLANKNFHPMEQAIADKLRIRVERVCCYYDFIIVNTLNFGATPELETQITQASDEVREWLVQWEAGPQWSKPLTFELSID